MMLLSIILVTLVNVVLRTFGSGSITWADEFARVTFVMFSFLAAGLACCFGAHLVVIGVVDKFQNRVRKVFLVLRVIVSGAFFLAIIVIGYTQTIDNLGQRTPAIDFPVGMIYGVVSFSGLLMLVNSLMSNVVGIAGVKDGRIVLGHLEENLEEVA